MQLDFVVYGASVEGLLVANYLHQKGLRVLVLEPSAKIGGAFAPVEFRKTHIVNVLSSFALSAEKLSSEFLFQDSNVAPTTFEKGHFEPFVGFGENAPKFVNYLSAWSQSHQTDADLSLTSWIKNLQTSGLPIRVQTTITAVTVTEGRITEVLINDKEKVRAENFVFAVHPSDIVELFEKDSLPTKISSKLSKTDYWSAIQLSVVHNKPVTDKTEIHFLYGTQKDPVVSVGRFHDCTSQWLSLISADNADIHEEGVQILKEMKRQIRRAYPEAFDNVVFEKIALLPKVFGFVDLKSKYFGQIEGLENLCLCSSNLVDGPSPLVNALKAAQMTKDLLGGLIERASKGPSAGDSTEINAPV